MWIQDFRCWMLNVLINYDEEAWCDITCQSTEWFCVTILLVVCFTYSTEVRWPRVHSFRPIRAQSLGRYPLHMTFSICNLCSAMRPMWTVREIHIHVYTGPIFCLGQKLALEHTTKTTDTNQLPRTFWSFIVRMNLTAFEARFFERCHIKQHQSIWFSVMLMYMYTKLDFKGFISFSSKRLDISNLHWT